MQHSEGLSAYCPPTSSRSTPKRNLSFTRRHEETHSATTSASVPHASRGTTLDPTGQTKRQKTMQSSLLSDPRDTVGKSMRQVSRPDVIYMSKNFQPQTGIRRLVIKNLKTSPRSSLQDHYDQLWTQVSDALKAIYAGQQPQQPLERLYRDVEDICRNGQAEELFHHLNSECNSYLQKNLLPHISSQIQAGSRMIETLRIVHNGWEMWSSCSVRTSAYQNCSGTDLFCRRCNYGRSSATLIIRSYKTRRSILS